MTLDDASKVAAIIAVLAVFGPGIPPVRRFLFGTATQPPSPIAPAILGSIGALLVVSLFVLFIIPGKPTLEVTPGTPAVAEQNSGDKNWTAEASCKDEQKIVGFFCEIQSGSSGGGMIQNIGSYADNKARCVWNNVTAKLAAHIVPLCARIK